MRVHVLPFAGHAMRLAWPIGLSLLVLLSALGLVMVTVERQTLRLVAEERGRVEALYVEARERELQHYVLLARAATERIAAETGDARAHQQQALAILARMRFGQDGYFFVYDQQGRILLDPEQMETQGVAFCEPDAPGGQRQAELILAKADSGGGWVRYAWARPASLQPVPKMSYVTTIEPWGWTLGAGLYLDEVESRLQQLDARARESIAQTHRHLAAIAALAIGLAGLGWLVSVLWQQRNARRRIYQLVTRLGDVREGERQRLGRELHDGVVQVVVSTRHLIEAAQRHLRPGPARRADRSASADVMLQASLSRLDEALGEIRRVAHGMLPARLAEQDLPEALDGLYQQWRQECPFTVTADLSHVPRGLPPALRVAVLRILQEGMANVVRHAGARHARVSVRAATDGLLRVCVEDDGRGFEVDPALRGPGVGLRNLRERARAFGGDVVVRTGADGTCLEASLALPAACGAGHAG